MKRLTFITGAGISKESGLSTFRDCKDGLWNNYDIFEVATPEGWENNPQKVLDFYNERRREIKKSKPNDAHKIIAELEKNFKVTIITQNIDDLHERAGSSDVIHIHGEIFRMREDTPFGAVDFSFDGDINLGDTSIRGLQWRPDVVWFGEMVKRYNDCLNAVADADILVIIGTSLQIQPVASMYLSAKSGIDKFLIDPAFEFVPPEFVAFKETATAGMKILKDIIEIK